MPTPTRRGGTPAATGRPATGCRTTCSRSSRYARRKGLLCGLWVEIESAGKASKLAAEHPGLVHHALRQAGGARPRPGQAGGARLRRGHILRLIERYRLDMFRLDYNLDAWEGGFNLRDGRQENTLWRHVEAMYAIFDTRPRPLSRTCSSRTAPAAAAAPTWA